MECILDLAFFTVHDSGLVKLRAMAEKKLAKYKAKEIREYYIDMIAKIDAFNAGRI